MALTFASAEKGVTLNTGSVPGVADLFVKLATQSFKLSTCVKGTVKLAKGSSKGKGSVRFERDLYQPLRERIA
jgi:hypothetical protein